MAERRDIVFLFNLLQDVNILRGLVQLAADETEARLSFLVSKAFTNRDRLEIWGPELAALADEVGAKIKPFGSSVTVAAHLEGRGGLIIAASESHLDAHAETRNAFRIAPARFLKVTLQHGLECIGFRQSREHVMSHGRNVTFNADVVCAWLPADKLTALAYSERGKLWVTGAPTLLQKNLPHPAHPPGGGGLICENMHSVRLHASGNHRGAFMEIFFAFCREMAQEKTKVTLRPHPGGQYVLKNKVALPKNVELNTLPTYHVDFTRYGYGISAPSTIVLDMVLAGLPTAVWCDPDGIMDVSNYDGLTMISSLEDWLAFVRDAALRPEAILARQRDFLARLGMITDPEVVRGRFRKLFSAGLETHVMPERPRTGARALAPDVGLRRILVVSDPASDVMRTRVLDPLATAALKGEVTLGLLSETQFHGPSGVRRAQGAPRDWLAGQIEAFQPDLIVVCDWQSEMEPALRNLAGGRPILFVADPGFAARTGRGQAALLAAADLAHVDSDAMGQMLKRMGMSAEVCTGPFAAALARGLDGRQAGVASARGTLPSVAHV